MGTASMAVTMVTKKVPKMAGKMPPSVMPRRGAWETNSQLKVAAPFASYVIEEN